MKKFVIDESLKQMFPTAQFGVVVVKNMQNGVDETRSKMGRLKSSLAAGCIQTEKYLLKEDIDENKVIKIWIEAYAKFASGKQACASVVSLLKTAHDTGNIDSVNALVDICTSDSLIWALPISTFDTDKITGELHLGELNGDICFYDGQGPLSAAWTHEFAERAKVTHETKNALLIINLIDPTRAMELKACINTLAKQPVSYLGAQTSSVILDEQTCEAEF